MDLRSIINNEAGDGSKHAAPVTPVQAHPPQGFREYNHPLQASPGPGKHLSQDYGVQQPSAPYPSPNNYPGNYQGRPPPPPPIQAPPQNDLRSPARTFSGQSPYQHPPVSANQYPFPPAHQAPQSPAQSNQYPPSHQQRDSYSHSNPPPHLQNQPSFHQGSPPPQTPPVGIPGAPHPYLQHQRSQSSLSTPTPTSAKSQQQYFPQYSQDSPVSGGHFPPSQIPQHQRQQSQQSQPGTPLGPPLTQRSSTGAFPQPSSPYQQRGLSSGSFSQFQQTSPAPPAPATIPRLPSTPSGGYDSQRTSLSEQHRRSQSERERSLSVSPKTRLPSQPRGEVVTPKSENGYMTGPKRKMEEREMPIEDPQCIIPPGPKPHVNGNSDNRIPSSSPQQPPRKRVRYTEPPVWARSVRTKGAYVTTGRPAKTNGKQPAVDIRPQTGPLVAIKNETNGTVHSTPPVPHPATSMEEPVSGILGQWEKSITGKKPVEEMTKIVADFIFLNVIRRGDLGELSSRGVQVEIEAKLGQLVDKDTNQRYHLPVRSECILGDLARVGFRSSMTEAQHQTLNEFLNARVAETHPQNPGGKGRVKIDYLHRRETDKFYELPPAMQAQLPAAVRDQLNPRHAVKVRVTHDQKTGHVIAKIIKARLIDLNIFSPQSLLDCRISINLEMRFDGDIEDLIATGSSQRLDSSPDRNKDRLSYTQSYYQIDLTQVTQTTVGINGQSRTEKEHELEIEISTAAIMDQGLRAANGQPNEYATLIEGFLDNVRVLQRKVPPQ